MRAEKEPSLGPSVRRPAIIPLDMICQSLFWNRTLSIFQISLGHVSFYIRLRTKMLQGERGSHITNEQMYLFILIPRKGRGCQKVRIPVNILNVSSGQHLHMSIFSSSTSFSIENKQKTFCFTTDKADLGAPAVYWTSFRAHVWRQECSCPLCKCVMSAQLWKGLLPVAHTQPCWEQPSCHAPYFHCRVLTDKHFTNLLDFQSHTRTAACASRNHSRSRTHTHAHLAGCAGRKRRSKDNTEIRRLLSRLCGRL